MARRRVVWVAGGGSRKNLSVCLSVCVRRFHPVGFAYIAGGAHTVCRDSGGTAGECPEVGGVAEAASNPTTASVLQYFVDNVNITNDESGFGLDTYEPLFFNSQVRSDHGSGAS